MSCCPPPAPDGASPSAFPPWHPEPHAHSLCTSGLAGKGEGAVVLPLSGAPSRFRSVWGPDASRSYCKQTSPQTLYRKAKVPAWTKGSAGRPASTNHRGSCTRPMGCGCSAVTPPPAEGCRSANTVGPSISFAQGPCVNDVKLNSVLRFGYVYTF